MLSPKLVQLLAGIIAVAVLLSFLGLFGYAIGLIWFSPGNASEFSQEYVIIATTLGGLVGAVAAMNFNEKLPDAPTSGTSQPPSGSSMIATPSASGPEAGFTALKNSMDLKPGLNLLQTTVSASYVICYFLIGLLALITWAFFSRTTPDLIKNLGLIFMGLGVAIARSFFSLPR